MMPEQRQQNNDRQRNAEQPEQRATTKAHVILLSRDPFIAISA
jgi:hypothetical protein